MSLRIFISSVQKELELERAAVASLITTDPSLLQHCVPVLFEKEPPSPRPAQQPYLEALKGCQAYVLMVATEYGPSDGEVSATHHEYRRAQQERPHAVWILRNLVTALVGAGCMEDAKVEFAHLRAAYPDLAVAKFKKAMVFSPAVLIRMGAQLSTMGLPD